MKKTNRTFKRFAAITSASLLAACALMPAVSSAADIKVGGFSTSDNNDASKHSLVAYQIFKGKMDSTNTILTEADFGEGINATGLSQALVTASGTEGHILYGKFPQLYEENNTTPRAYTAKDIMAALSATETKTENGEEVTVPVFGDDAATTQAFAEIVAANIGNATKITPDSTSGNFINLAAGYYLIQDESISSETGAANTGAKTRYILQLTDTDASINIKSSAPTVQKKVYEDQDANKATEAAKHEASTELKWNDVADYDIGDAVPFKLYGTLPSTYEDYNAYYYCFTDTLGKEFDAPKATDFTVFVGTTKVEIGKNLRINVTPANDTTDTTIKISFEDIKDITTNEEDVITVTYNAVLNENAVVGTDGQKNKVKLTYSNNPNVDYNPNLEDETEQTDGNTGETKEDEVVVHTYAVKFNKTFYNVQGGEITSEELENDVYKGAKFSLKKGEETLHFKKSEDTKYDYVLKSADDVITEGDTLLELTKTETEFVIRIKGLDEGDYTLSEEVAPNGYNKAAPQTINIGAETANGQAWDASKESLTEFSWTVDEVTTTEGDVEGEAISAIALATMMNKKGSSLPGTGGIGTTIFYLGGGAMAAIGGIYLISKRRMKKSEE